MAETTVTTTMWRDGQAAIVEDIPAHVCGSCMEQFYDEYVSDALRQLAEDGFPASAAQREIVVPVFSLKERIRRPAAPPDEDVPIEY